MDTKIFGNVIDRKCNFLAAAIFWNDSKRNLLDLKLIIGQKQDTYSNMSYPADNDSIYELECFALYPECCKYTTRTFRIDSSDSDDIYSIIFKKERDDLLNITVEIDLTKVPFASESDCISKFNHDYSKTFRITMHEARDCLKSKIFLSNLPVFEKFILLIRRPDIMEKIPLLIQPTLSPQIDVRHLTNENKRLHSIIEQAAVSMIDNKRKPSNIVKIANSLKQEIVVR